MATVSVADDPGVVLLDSSIAVALLVEDHVAHPAARAATRGRALGLAGHAWFETYSVLTRLPGGLRRSPADAQRLLHTNFPKSTFLSAAHAAQLASELAQFRISGGSVYDALVGAAAREAGQRLLSADTRAGPTYEALGVDLELISS